jgi:hypothetical protein
MSCAARRVNPTARAPSFVLAGASALVVGFARAQPPPAAPPPAADSEPKLPATDSESKPPAADAEPTPTAEPAPAPAPAPPAPPVAQPQPAAPAPAAAATADRETAWIRVASDRPGTYLEMREFEGEPWRRVCDAPCDQRVNVEGMQVRARAPGMTTSNMFRIEPGTGVARLRVSGGSADTRSLGLTGLIIGIPVSLGGMVVFGYGNLKEESAFVTAGIITLAVGAVLTLGSLPFLYAGGTTVRDSRGKLIASRDPALTF